MNPPDPQNQRRWREVHGKGLCPQVGSLEQYEELVGQDMLLAHIHLLGRACAVPVLETILEVHAAAFSRVYPWAGTVRGPRDTAIIGGQLAAEAPRILIELDMCRAQTEALLTHATSVGEQMAALAFSHARFERIHPFKDGNGRVGRLLLDSQLNAVFGMKEQRIALDRIIYMQALRTASAGNLTPLTNVLLKREGLELIEVQKQTPPSYRLAPFFISEGEKPRTLEEELHRSHAQGPGQGLTQ